MTKEVAVVHWKDGGAEKKARAYTIQMLSQLIETMNKKGVVYWVCLTQLDTIIPVSTQNPTTAFIEDIATVGRLAPLKPLERAFTDVTRIDLIHHPPNIEQVKKAYGH